MPRDRQLFDRSMGELLAQFVRKRWPRDTAKTVARKWGVDPSTATNLIKGHASERTITKAIQAEGWPLIMALGEAVTGRSYADFLQDIIHETERAREHAATRRDTFVSLEARAFELVALLAGPLAEPARGDAGSSWSADHVLGADRREPDDAR
ncbi:hypothetical protein [Phenylobacterium immobile]|uniref:hypothetical protein n=1 Tax=Phenylobacterium immobile TaxID=21 RepID=UPI0011461820|nr:hypothetical protein [Phenylobacterium immobile]